MEKKVNGYSSSCQRDLMDCVLQRAVIDVEATSEHLKALRLKEGIKVSDLQRIFGMKHPQSIYYWEDRRRKTLPSLDNLMLLSRLYSSSLDELLVLRGENKVLENL